MNQGEKRMKKILFILLTLVFVSCNSVGDDTVSKSNGQEKLNNKADQEKVNQLTKNISINNYSQTVAKLAGVYAKRTSIIGRDADSPNGITQKVFSVWPRKTHIKPNNLEKQLASRLKIFQSRAEKLKVKTGKSVSAFDVMLNSREADTTFSDITKKYLRDVQKVFNKHHKSPSFYISKLQKLAKMYQLQYSLTNKEYIVIIGISKSVSTYLDILNHSNIKRLAYSSKDSKRQKITPNIPLLKTDSGEGGANCQYTDNNGNFDPDWGDVAFAGVMGAGVSMLNFTTQMGWTAFVGQATLDPEALAVEYATSGIVGTTEGSIIELSRERTLYSNCVQ